MNEPHSLHLCVRLCVQLGITVSILGGALSPPPHAQGTPLPTRAVEEVGRAYIGEPVSSYVGHLAMLFVTGKHPTIGNGTMQDTIDWVNDPLHSVIADGSGGLAVYAHPESYQRVLLFHGLTGMELFSQGTIPGSSGRDQMWDTVLTTLLGRGEPIIWCFAADDTHSTSGSNWNYAWNTSLVSSVDAPSLKRALKTGAFYTTNGPAIAGVAVNGTTITLNLPQSADVLWLRAGQYNAGGTFSQTTATGSNRAVKIQTGVTSSSLDVASTGVAVSDLKFVRAIVRTSSSRYALTQPFQVSSTGAVSNPYPASGTWISGQSHNHSDAPIDNTTLTLTFRSNYASVGQLASFDTAYSYWETPYQRPASDGYPDISSVSPGKVASGAAQELTVEGVNFAAGISVQLGSYPLANITVVSASQLRATVPVDVPPGVYDLVVTSPSSYRGTLPFAVTVQDPTASNTGWTSYKAPTLSWNQTTSIVAVGNEVWVGSLKGASQYKNGVWSTFVPSGGQNIFSRGIYAITPDSSGGLWFSSVGLWFRNASGAFPWQFVTPPSSSSQRWGRAVFDHSGSLWVTSRWIEGLAIRSPSGSWTRLTTSLPDQDTTQAITVDQTGNVWVGFSDGYGVRKWNGSSWTIVPVPGGTSGLAQATFASVLTTAANGDVWAAVQPMNTVYDPQNSGVVRYIGGDPLATEVIKSPPLPHPRITDILVDSAGNQWFASRSGVARLNTVGQWQTYTTQNSGLVSNIVMAMTEDASGNIWFATDDGVSVFSAGSSSNRPPVVTSPGNQTSAVGESVSLPISATDPDGDVLTYEASGLPTGLSISSTSGVISGTVASTAASSNSVIVTASDGSLSGTSSFDWTVTGGNGAPVVTNPGTQTTMEGTSVSLAIAASDPDGDALTFSAAGLPAGLAIDSTTGLISGTIAIGAAATNSVVVTASDGVLSGTAGFTWTVTRAVPAAPSSLAATATSASQVALTWSDNAVNESGVKIERSTNATSGFAQIATVTADVTSYVSTGLNAATTYYYRVRAYNSGGDSTYSNVANATTLDGPPAAPTNLSATANSTSQITVTWIDRSSNEDGFRVERGSGNGRNLVFVEIGVLGINAQSYVDTGLTANTSYTYRVRAFNGSGTSAYSNTVSAKTKPK